jgi:hypothetical protein
VTPNRPEAVTRLSSVDSPFTHVAALHEHDIIGIATARLTDTIPFSRILAAFS